MNVTVGISTAVLDLVGLVWLASLISGRHVPMRGPLRRRLGMRYFPLALFVVAGTLSSLLVFLVSASFGRGRLGLVAVAFEVAFEALLVEDMLDDGRWRRLARKLRERVARRGARLVAVPT